MQDGDLQDLEDVDGTITITDLGLNEFRMDMVAYIKAHGEPKTLHTVCMQLFVTMMKKVFQKVLSTY